MLLEISVSILSEPPTIINSLSSVSTIPSGVSVTIQKTDKDKNGYPIGFLSTWQTSNAGTGSILFKLMHKTALKGPNDGPNVGHSDIQLNLPIIIK